MKTRLRFLSLLVPFSFATGATALVLQDDAGWKPWQFQVGETYEFRMTDHSRPDQAPIQLVLDLAPSEVQGKDGAKQVAVSYTTTVLVKESELGPQTAFGGGAGALAMGPAMLMLNPMITGFADQLTLEVGEKMALFGAGRIEITEKVKVAGIEGFLCKMYGPKQQEQAGALQFEWVVNPEIAAPLKSVTYDRKGQKTMEFELVSYSKR